MSEISRQNKLKLKWLCGLIALLLIPALLINLGLIAFIDDEGLRSLVALEMKFSGNYITPTFFGAYYYNKPPLYNWILLAFFELTGRADEWSARLPTVLFLLAYAATIYYFFRKHYARPLAILNAFALITCGRILFWESMLALIDICFSWVIFTLFMVIYHLYEKKKWYALFASAWGLAAIGFLLKGLPALVFVGTALLVRFLFPGKDEQTARFSKLFSLAHVTGFLVFVILVGGYYYAYHQYNDLQAVFETLFNESSKRTFVQYGWQKTLVHFFTFPFEMTWHFLPWSLFGVYLFRKGALRHIRQHHFTFFNAVLFLATIIVYWLSVEVYPRYLLMHAPLIFSVFLFLHDQNQKEKSLWYIRISRIIGTLCILFFLGALLPAFIPQTRDIPHVYLKTGFIFATLGGLAYLFWRWEKERWIVFVAFLLVLRIGFNWFVLPNRLKIEWSTQVRNSSIQIARQFQPLYIYKNSLGFEPANGFYLTRESNRIIRRQFENFDTAGWYIIHKNYEHHLQFKESARLKVMYEQGFRYVGKIKLKK
ncbi:MAG: hypothetical protein D6714_09925 [Bacteroidetes bacterium]|nr:MAG: hypothetical protein D6714_09925 [Bacteroidota bacterium]